MSIVAMRNSKKEHKKNLCIWVIRLVYLDNIGVPMKRTYQRGDQKIEKKWRTNQEKDLK